MLHWEHHKKLASYFHGSPSGRETLTEPTPKVLKSTKYFGGKWRIRKPCSPAYTRNSKMKQLRSSADYGYRTNDDGSTDLICLYCGDTVLNTSVKDDLRKAEEEHLCDAKRAKRTSAANWNPGTRRGRVM